MPEIKIRSKHQITLPAGIMREAKFALGDRLRVSYTNGVIVLKPRSKVSSEQEFDLMAYAGIGKGLWGNTAEEVDKYIADLRG